MSIRVSVYDFFSFTIPGVLYLGVIILALSVFGIVPVDWSAIPSLDLVGLTLIIGIGYLAGRLFDPVAEQWSRLFRRHRAAPFTLEKFLQTHPWLQCNFNADDWGILFAVVKQISIDVAADIQEHNAVSKMLRNVSLGLALLAIVFVAYYLVAAQNYWNIVIAALCLCGSISAIRTSIVRREWFYTEVYETIAANGLRSYTWFSTNTTESDDTTAHLVQVQIPVQTAITKDHPQISPAVESGSPKI